MKKAGLGICLLHILIGSSAQSIPDSIAIKKLLTLEGLTWRTGNLAAHANCWSEQPNNFILVSTGKGAVMEVNPSLILHPSPEFFGTGGFSIHTNYTFSIHQNTAWVKHD
jgi:hypothetical protein